MTTPSYPLAPGIPRPYQVSLWVGGPLVEAEKESLKHVAIYPLQDPLIAKLTSFGMKDPALAWTEIGGWYHLSVTCDIEEDNIYWGTSLACVYLTDALESLGYSHREIVRVEIFLQTGGADGVQ